MAINVQLKTNDIGKCEYEFVAFSVFIWIFNKGTGMYKHIVNGNKFFTTDIVLIFKQCWYGETLFYVISLCLTMNK